MENLIQKAIRKAIELHAGQVRKGDGKTPYVVHAIEVGMRVAILTNHEKLIAAAILHDTVEDCGYTASELKADFGWEIADWVAILSEDKSIEDWQERKSENISRLRQCKPAYLVKVIDAMVDMKDLVASLKEEGDIVWQRFNAGKKEKITYYYTIFKDMRDSLDQGSVEEYASLLKDLEYSPLWAPYCPLLPTVI